MKAPLPPVCLASTSPRRAQLLAQLQLDFDIISVNTNETPLLEETADALVSRLAIGKANAVLSMYPERSEQIIIGADTIVVTDDIILGKPKSAEDSRRILSLLTGRTHRVLTAVACLWRGRMAVAISETAVTMRLITPQEIAAYIASGEPSDKAGSYAIQGLGALFVEQITGSYSGVMGLPLYETAQLLKECGLDCLLKTRIAKSI